MCLCFCVCVWEGLCLFCVFACFCFCVFVFLCLCVCVFACFCLCVFVRLRVCVFLRVWVFVCCVGLCLSAKKKFLDTEGPETAKNTVNYSGFRGNAVTLGWELSGRRAGAARHYNLRLPTEGLRQGHGRGRRPDFRMHVIGGRSDEFNDFKFEGSGTRSSGKTGEGAWKRQGLWDKVSESRDLLGWTRR